MAFYDKERGGLVLHTSGLLEAAGAIHAFTTRTGGVSQGIYASLNLGTNRGDDPALVRENYRRVCGALGVDPAKLVFSSQVHKDHIRTVTGADLGKGLDRKVDYEADGLITDLPGVTLTVFGADCLTILLCDPVKRVIAAVHAGWRGTALGIAEGAAERMISDYNCNPKDIRAAIGPGISRCCFETDGDVPRAMEQALGSAVTEFVDRGETGKYHVDLKGINTLRLKRCGILTTNIDTSPDCTVCRPERYWSHRVTKGQRGSQAALLCLPEETV